MFEVSKEAVKTNEEMLADYGRLQMDFDEAMSMLDLACDALEYYAEETNEGSPRVADLVLKHIGRPDNKKAYTARPQK